MYASIFIEYMPRGDLLSILKKSEGPLDPEIVRKIFVQIVYAVSHLHDKDIVHRYVFELA